VSARGVVRVLFGLWFGLDLAFCGLDLKFPQYNYNNNSNADDKPEYNNNSNAKDNPKFNDNVLFDFKDNKSNNSAADEDINGHSCLNNSYSSNKTNVIIIEGINKRYTTELDKYK
jgi:hypothetical protein